MCSFQDQLRFSHFETENPSVTKFFMTIANLGGLDVLEDFPSVSCEVANDLGKASASISLESKAWRLEKDYSV